VIRPFHKIALCRHPENFEIKSPSEMLAKQVARRGSGWGGSPDPTASSNRRYIEGQRIYLCQDEPQAHANVVIDYSDFTAPVVKAWRWPEADNPSQENN
jgi:uridine kinase